LNPAAKHNWTLNPGSGGTLSLATSSGTPSLVVNSATNTISAVVAGTSGFNKNGAGYLALSGAGTVTGVINVNGGTLEMQNKSGDTPYTVAPGATLKIGYSTGGGYANTAMTINGSGAAATNGFFLAGGKTYNVSGGVVVNGAPTTIRQYGSGLASLGIFDVGSNPGLSISAAASGSATDPNIQMVSDGYGMVVTTAAGANTAAGDLIINGSLNVGTLGLYTRGTGSVLLNGLATTGNVAVQIQGGAVICGITNCLGVNASVPILSGAMLALNGYNQTVSSLNVATGGTLSFGGTNTLTVGNAPVLAGNLQMAVNKSATAACSQLVVSGGTLTNGGTLTVINQSTGTLAAGDTFTLFSAPGYAGNFTSVTLPALPVYLGWNTNSLLASGVISITNNSSALWWNANRATAGAQDGSGNWGAAGTWWNGSANVPWADNMLAIFGSGTATNCSVALTNSVAPGGIAFNANGGGVYTISGSSPLNLANQPLIGCSGNATISAVLTNGGLTVSGPGALTLTATNVYAGGTTISSGTLVVGGAGRLGGGFYAGTITNNGSLLYNSTAAQTLSGILSGTGTLTQSGPGTLTLSNANTYSGQVVVTGALLKLGNVSALSAAGGTVVTNGGALDLNGQNLGANNNPVTLAGLNPLTNSSTTKAYLENVTLGADTTINIANAIVIGSTTGQSGTLNLNGFTLTKAGSGNLDLNGLSLISAGNLVINGGVVQIFDDYGASQQNTTLSGGGQIIVNPGGSLNSAHWGSSQVITMPVVMNGGTLGSGWPSPNGATFACAIVLSNNSVINFGGGYGAATISGPISGNYGLTVTGDGNTRTFTGANTYTGFTTIGAGTMLISGSGYLGGGNYAGAITNNATLNYSSSAAQTLAGVISGPGILIQSGPGTLTLSATNTYTNTTTISSGTLALGGAGQLGGGAYATPITNNGTLNYSSSAAQTLSGVISGTGNLIVNGPGTLTLTAVNTYTGGTTVNAGTLQLNKPNGDTSAVGPGVLTINAGATVVSANKYPFGNDDSAVTPGLVVNGGTWNSQTYNSAALSYTLNNGTLTRASAAWYFNQPGFISATNGSSAISGGIMYLYGIMPVTVSPGATLTISAALKENSVSGLTLLGGGTLTLLGTNTYSGGTVVSNGLLLVNGSLAAGGGVTVAAGATLGGTGVLNGAVTNNGTLAPGSSDIGTLTISNTVSLLAGTVVMELSKAAGGSTTNDLLSVSTALTCAGGLVVTNIGTNALAAGDSFKLFSAPGYAGNFSSLTLPALAGSLVWNTNTLATSGTLTVAAVNLAPPVVTNATLSVNGKSFTLSGTGAPNQAYVMLGASNLAPPVVWQPLVTNTAGTNGAFILSDPQTTNFPQRFYRVGTP
jgi:autotransporter-associated beta strand protein